MALFDPTRTAGWGQNPQFPVGRGQWTPLTLFALSTRLNFSAETALALVAGIATELDLEVAPSSDLNAIFSVATETQLFAATEAVIGKVSSLDTSLALGFNSDLNLSNDSNDLDLFTTLTVTSESTLAIMKSLAIQQGLIAETSSGMIYVGAEHHASILGFSSSSSMNAVRTMNFNRSLVLSSATALKKIARLTASLNAFTNSWTELQLIQNIPEFGVNRTGTQSGTGTGWLNVSNQVLDSTRGGWSVSSSGPAVIPAKYQPYPATVRAECSHTGGSSPRYGQTRVSINGDIYEGAQQSASPGTSFVETVITLKGGDQIYWNWRGEGNFLNRPTLQAAGSWLRVTPL